MKLIVGLGNPGNEYRSTRHNVGFMVVDRLAQRHGLAGARTKFHAGVIEGAIGNERVMLMQPTTFMNRSGLAVGEAARFHKLEPTDLVVVVDDFALPLGGIRLRAGGSAGGHNGLADVQRAIGSAEYPRLRVGIGAPVINDRRIDQADYVLSRFGDEEQGELMRTIEKSCDAIETWLARGIDIAMTKHNVRCEPDEPKNRDADSPRPTD
jgi:PTH1 family peptidyl-tRNA hydrolase